MKKHKPIILISHATSQSHFMLFCLRVSVLLSGGKPVFISPHNQHQQNIKEHFDGLLLAGGVDVDPHRYFEERKTNYAYDFDRDALEFELIETAYSKKIPVLAICRGAQLMNVAHHGTLYLDLQKAFEKAQYPNHLLGYIFYRKKMHVEKDSLLYDVLHQTETKVNSLHKQAINLLGDNLKITARDFNGIVQCIESPSLLFYIGVQFHPEFLIYRPSMLRLFRRFVKSAIIFKNID